MNDSRITVVGVGALGSHFVQFLRNTDKSIHVIDMDNVERKNITSQFHSVTGVGKNKTLALKQTMDFLFKRKIAINTNKLIESNVHELLIGSDLVVDCLDNFAARKLVQDFTRAQKIPTVHGATSADGSFGRVVWDEKFTIDAESMPGQATACEDGVHLPFIGIVSAYLAQTVQRYFTSGEMVNYQIHQNGIVKF